MNGYIAYYRVSTDRQGKSGLGLDAQKKQVRDFISNGNGTLTAEYVEVESGKNNDRPELAKAIRQSQLTGNKLVIAKLDRLSRSLHYITSLAESKVDFIVCDLPGCDQFTINLYGALAQRERELISTRTKSALQASKARGKVLGSPQNLTEDAAAKGRVLGVEARKQKADEFAEKVAPIINGYINDGLSLNQIARELNKDNILTARGKAGSWTPTAVKNVLDRLAA
ncbi:recombinase family protein [Desulfuromonas sp. KJ2020]|uniref:recombinase family protein n=1 Tax=Desulfuromonas sp. KJ2020 TaxID=2919173 RepID=UPI0020A7E247|nr:recombinase family protein [Desulfuromonas sp. KJ2020]MCP3176103.1 recombinase family protein [Desulfuromonas sp. KJ2020]